MNFHIEYNFCFGRISNPHLRASLAKMCQYFLPLAKNDIQINPIFESTGDLFEQFQYGPMLGISLLTIFVDVEYTGMCDR